MNSLLFMGKKLSVKEKIELVKRNTYEIIGEEDLEKLFKKKQNKPSVYLGTAPTGRPHVGYFVWALKIADLLLQHAGPFLLQTCKEQSQNPVQ